MGSWDWKPYESVAERKQKAEKTIAKIEKKTGKKLSPIKIEGKKIADSFWGKAWCKHIESFGDYESRLSRGRSYARHGSVIDLKILPGVVKSMVQGSEIYDVDINIVPLDTNKWNDIVNKCSGQISSVIELLQGKISSSIMTSIADQQNGLFPLQKEISFDCSCPDFASMCKHIAAVFYGIGSRLDLEPELLFMLRKVDHMELVNNVTIATKSKKSAKTIQNQDLSELFGIDIDDDI